MSTNIQVLPGKVGISNTNPTHTLDIGSNVYVDDTGTDVLTVNGQVRTSNILVDHEINIGALKITATRGLQSDDNFNVSSNLEVGTANLFVDTSTSNVGIGTRSPAYTLDVRGKFFAEDYDATVTNTNPLSTTSLIAYYDGRDYTSMPTTIHDKSGLGAKGTP